MPLILEFNKLIADLQKHKKDQAQKRVTFWEDEHQCLASTSRDAVLDLPPLSPWTETPSKTTSTYHDTRGRGGGTQHPGDLPWNPTDSQKTRCRESKAAGNQDSQGGSNPTQSHTTNGNPSGQNSAVQSSGVGVGAVGATGGAGGGDNAENPDNLGGSGKGKRKEGDTEDSGKQMQLAKSHSLTHFSSMLAKIWPILGIFIKREKSV